MAAKLMTARSRPAATMDQGGQPGALGDDPPEAVPVCQQAAAPMDPGGQPGGLEMIRQPIKKAAPEICREGFYARGGWFIALLYTPPIVPHKWPI